MKVLVAVFDSAIEKRVMELLAPVEDAFKSLSPKAVHETSTAFVKSVKALGIATCILTEDEWGGTLSSVRKEHAGFCADYVLSRTDVVALSEVTDPVAAPIRRLISAFGKDNFGIAFLPLDEEVLDDSGV